MSSRLALLSLIHRASSLILRRATAHWEESPLSASDPKYTMIAPAISARPYAPTAGSLQSP